MDDFTPYQLEYYNKHTRQFAAWPKHFLVWLIQPLFCALVVSQIFYEYNITVKNWIYFFSLILVMFNAIGACAITLMYICLCTLSWIESLDIKEMKDDFQSEDNFQNKMKNKIQSVRLKIIPVTITERNIIFYIDILNDAILSAAFVSVGYPFMGISYAAIIIWQHLMLNKSRKKVVSFISSLEDPFEDAEKENIDDLANKLFHGDVNE